MTNINVGIIDDEKLFIEGLKMILSDQPDISVNYTAYDGIEFIDHVISKGVPSDVFLLDLSMPGKDGVDTLKELMNINIQAKVIILSSHYNDGIIIRLLDEGASGYLAKNADPKEVVETIRGVFNNGFHINNEILQLIRNRKLFSKKASAPIDLSSREIEVLKLICEENTNKEIAAKLFISPRTVEGHRTNIQDKTSSKNTAGLVIYAIEHKLIQVNISKYF